MNERSETAGGRPPEPPTLKQLSRHLQQLIRSRLWLQVLVAMVLGIGAGMAIGPGAGWMEPATAAVIGNWLAFPGQLFLAVIQMIVIPLVFASIILGLAAVEDIEQLRRIGLRAVLYFVVTTAAAIVIGLALAYLIRPGALIDAAGLHSAASAAPAVSAKPMSAPSLANIPKQLLGLLPSNPLGSMVRSEMLQIVIFGFVVGVALVMMVPERARPILDLLASLQEVCMTVVRWAMRLAPIAVFGLLAQLTAQTGFGALAGMAAYVFTVLLGLVLLLGCYMALVAMLGGRNPWQYLIAIRELLLLAFSTSSSAAVMPMTLRTVEEKLGVRSSIAQFVIPLGATINMNGSALYQGVATIFLAQVYAVDIGPGGLLLLVLTAVGASIGAPGTPGVGIVIMSMLLTTVGIPPAGIALIMGLDRILDMSRTAINVAGDTVAAVLMDRWSEKPAKAEAGLEPSEP